MRCSDASFRRHKPSWTQALVDVCLVLDQLQVFKVLVIPLKNEASTVGETAILGKTRGHIVANK